MSEAAEVAKVADLVQRRASVLICGNARTMAPDVRAAFTDILTAPVVAELEASHRYLQDVWASSWRGGLGVAAPRPAS